MAKTTTPKTKKAETKGPDLPQGASAPGTEEQKPKGPKAGKTFEADKSTAAASSASADDFGHGPEIDPASDASGAATSSFKGKNPDADPSAPQIDRLERNLEVFQKAVEEGHVSPEPESPLSTALANGSFKDVPMTRAQASELIQQADQFRVDLGMEEEKSENKFTQIRELNGAITKSAILEFRGNLVADVHATLAGADPKAFFSLRGEERKAATEAVFASIFQKGAYAKGERPESITKLSQAMDDIKTAIDQSWKVNSRNLGTDDAAIRNTENRETAKFGAVLAYMAVRQVQTKGADRALEADVKAVKTKLDDTSSRLEENGKKIQERLQADPENKGLQNALKGNKEDREALDVVRRALDHAAKKGEQNQVRAIGALIDGQDAARINTVKGATLEAMRPQTVGQAVFLLAKGKDSDKPVPALFAERLGKRFDPSIPEPKGEQKAWQARQEAQIMAAIESAHLFVRPAEVKQHFAFIKALAEDKGPKKNLAPLSADLKEQFHGALMENVKDVPPSLNSDVKSVLQAGHGEVKFQKEDSMRYFLDQVRDAANGNEKAMDYLAAHEPRAILALRLVGVEVEEAEEVGADA